MFERSLPPVSPRSCLTLHKVPKPESSPLSKDPRSKCQDLACRVRTATGCERSPARTEVARVKGPTPPPIRRTDEGPPCFCFCGPSSHVREALRGALAFSATRHRVPQGGFYRQCSKKWATVRWEATSGISAVAVEGRRVSVMADSKIKDIRRSISSWSLSTFKKPRFSGPKIKLRLFSGGNKKDRKALTEVTSTKKDEPSKSTEPDNDARQISQGEATQSTYVLHSTASSLKLIDSDVDGDQRESPSPGDAYYERWFDAKDRLNTTLDDDYKDYQFSRYYDTSDARGSREVVTPGSQKAREWIKNFNEGAKVRAESSKDEYRTCSSGKSKSESNVYQNDSTEEVLVPASSKTDNQDYIKQVQKELYAEGPKSRSPSKFVEDAAELISKENIKKVFEVRRKLSVKSVVDAEQASYQQSDLYNASTPMALARKILVPLDSLDNSDEGILNVSEDTESIANDHDDAKPVETNEIINEETINEKNILYLNKVQSDHNLFLKTVIVKAEIESFSCISIAECKSNDDVSTDVLSRSEHTDRAMEFNKNIIKAFVNGDNISNVTNPDLPKTNDVIANREHQEDCRHIVTDANESNFQENAKMHDEKTTVSKEALRENKVEYTENDSIISYKDEFLDNMNVDVLMYDDQSLGQNLAEREPIIKVKELVGTNKTVEPGITEKKKNILYGKNFPKSIKTFADSLFSVKELKKGSKEEKSKTKLKKENISTKSNGSEATLEVPNAEEKTAEETVVIRLKNIPSIVIENVDLVTSKNVSLVQEEKVKYNNDIISSTPDAKETSNQPSDETFFLEISECQTHIMVNGKSEEEAIVISLDNLSSAIKNNSLQTSVIACANDRSHDTNASNISFSDNCNDGKNNIVELSAEDNIITNVTNICKNLLEFKGFTEFKENYEESNKLSTVGKKDEPMQVCNNLKNQETPVEHLRENQNIEQAPKPTPRTKKNRYGYSINPIQVNRLSTSIQDTQHSVILPQEHKKDALQIKCSQVDEHIYWEIEDSPSCVPIPSPRQRKQDKGQMPKSSTHSGKMSSMPEWIQVRDPIPSPRSKKGLNVSCQSIVSAEDALAIAYSQLIKPEGSYNCSPQKSETFYSGKAASIAYGVSNDNLDTTQTVVGHMRQTSLSRFLTSDKSLRIQNHSRHSVQEPIMTGLSNVKGEVVLPVQTMPTLKSKEEQERIPSLPQLNHTLEKEDLLYDVLYSVYYLMGCEGDSWIVSSSTDGPPKAVLTLAEVTAHLKEIFGLPDDIFERLYNEARNRKPIEKTVKVKIFEAKNLRPKTVQGSCNSFVVASLPSTGQTHRTRIEKDTLNPNWNQEFEMAVRHLQKDVVKLEVRHEHDDINLKKLSAIKDIKSVGRMLKEASANTHKKDSQLLGYLEIPLIEFNHDQDSWYDLQKLDSLSPQKEGVEKDRGSIRVGGEVRSVAFLSSDFRKGYDDLLFLLTKHHVTAMSNNNKEISCHTPWVGDLPFPSRAVLAQYAMALCLSPAQQYLSWWIIGSAVSNIDYSWLFTRLKYVLAHLVEGTYSEVDLQDLKTSVIKWGQEASRKLKNLYRVYSLEAGVISRHQLAYTLKIISFLQTNETTVGWLADEEILNVPEILRTCNINWWLMVSEELSEHRKSEEQISKLLSVCLSISTKMFMFLSESKTHYDPIFKQELNEPHFKNLYTMMTKYISGCVRPLLQSLNIEMANMDKSQDLTGDPRSQMLLEVGTKIWHLYRTLGNLRKLGKELPEEAHQESGIDIYHEWFSEGVMMWLELATFRSKEMIVKSVELDTFDPVGEGCTFSSSAVDVMEIFHDIKNWWIKLEWPDKEKKVILLLKILEDICDCGMYYCELLSTKVLTLFESCNKDRNMLITEQICVALNNIERVKHELRKLPEVFGVETLSQHITASVSSESIATQLQTSADRILNNSTENMEHKLLQFIDSVMRKASPILEKAVEKSCENGSAETLLSTLDDNLFLMRRHLDKEVFNMFLYIFWDDIVSRFKAIVSKCTEKRKSSFYGCAFDIVNDTKSFFAPSDGNGLSLDEILTSDYVALFDLLNNLRLSSEVLISRYYKERYEEQLQAEVKQKAQLYVKAAFSRSGKLIVEIIMARDMSSYTETSSVNSKISSPSSFNYYVKVQLIPSEWFESQPIKKTHTIKTDPAVYEEHFEFNLTPESNGVLEGFILFTLKDYNLGRTNTFLGESVTPLKDLAYVDISEINKVSDIHLKMTHPKSDEVTGGVKAFPIEGPMKDEKYRLAGMTNEERAWRAKWLKDQILTEREPVPVSGYYEARFNPIRRFYRWPLDKLFMTLVPSLGYEKAAMYRYYAGKIGIALGIVYLTCYYFKYNQNDWTSQSGWKMYHSKIVVLPGEPGYPFKSDRTQPRDYADQGFKNSPI